MNLSDNGLLEIAEHEGIVPAPYKDSVGVWTYGIGHTAKAGGIDPAELPRGMPANLDAAIDEAIKTFRQDVRCYEKRVQTAVKVPLEQHQFDALVSWDFNTGGALWRSKSGQPCQLVQQIHRGDMSGAGFMGWLNPPELHKRRTAEMNLFKTGDYDANGTTIPIWRVDENGRRRGIHSTISGAELLHRMGRGPVAEKSTLAMMFEFMAAIFGRKKT